MNSKIPKYSSKQRGHALREYIYRGYCQSNMKNISKTPDVKRLNLCKEIKEFKRAAIPKNW